MLSHGNLTIPSPSLAEFVSNCFAILDSVDDKITTFQSISTRTAAEYLLKKYSQRVHLTCEDHAEWGMYYSTKIIINIFYNNKHKIAADSDRKDVVSKGYIISAWYFYFNFCIVLRLHKKSLIYK